MKRLTGYEERNCVRDEDVFVFTSGIDFCHHRRVCQRETSEEHSLFMR